MNIYSKILLTILPLVLSIFITAVWACYYFSHKALAELAETRLTIRLAEAVNLTEEHRTILQAYGLHDVIAANVKAKNDAGSALRSIQIGQKGYILVVDTAGIIVNHPDWALVGRNVADNDWFSKIINNSRGQIVFRSRGESSLALYEYFNPWEWYILAVAPESEIYGPIRRMKPHILLLGVLVSLIIALALMVLVRRCTAPLKSLTIGAGQIGKGNLKARIEIPSEDEFGRLARVFNKMASQLEKTHTAIRCNEKYFRSLIENAKDMTTILAGNGKIVYESPSIEQYLGYTSGELINREFLQLVHPVNRPGFIRFFMGVREARNISESIEIGFRHKDGSWRTLEIVANNLLDDQTVSGVVLNCRDVSKRKQAQDALRKAEKEYRGIFENAIEGIYRCRWDGMLIAANPSFAQIAGYDSPEEMLSSTNNASQFFVSPNDLQRFIRILDEKGRLSEFETRLSRRDGSRIWVTISAYIARDAEGHSGYYEGSVLDITERKKTLDTLEKSQQELRRLANKLINAQEEERRRLARELHDDIGQRLAILAMEADQVEQPLNTVSDKPYDNFRRIRDELVKISEDIQSISRNLHPSILEDLGLQDAIKCESDTVMNREGIEINYEAGSVPPDLPQDVALCFYRILQEGLRNTSKHAEATEIKIHLYCQKNKICLSIEDNGRGFNLKELDKKPGLGLSSMQERIRHIGGSLDIRTKPGEGTRIEIKAPLENASHWTKAQESSFN